MQAGVYKHYKGGLYQVIGVGEHTETKERLVVYVSLTGATLPGPRVRCNPESHFNEIVDWPGAGKAPRYLPLGDEYR